MPSLHPYYQFRRRPNDPADFAPGLLRKEEMDARNDTMAVCMPYLAGGM